MDRRRTNSPSYTRQWSGGSSSTGSSSPVMSPAHPQSRLASTTGGISTVKRTQTAAAKAAAARLAKAMASSHTTDVYDDDEEEDDLGFRYSAPPPPLPSAYSGANGFRSNGIRVNRSPSPALGRNVADNNATGRSTSAGRPSVSARPTPMMPPPPRAVMRMPAAVTHLDSPSGRFGNRGFLATMNDKTKGSENLEASALRDELDMLQEENEVITDKLRQAEEKREQAEARARELEKQVASLGEGVSLEAKLLSRKEAALRQREAALKAAQQNKDGREEEIATLRSEIEHLKEETTSALEKVQEVESEAKALRNMTQRMILTQEEMEEVVLKRCWLARFWGLAVEHGIFADIAGSKHEYWSSLAPLPFELVISAGQKAKEESAYNDSMGKQVRNFGDLTGEGNIESMLSVEMALRELASLKVEDAVAVALSLSRRSSIFRHHSSETQSPRGRKFVDLFSETKSPSDRKFVEASEISQKEADDVRFKEAWLTYFWRRAKAHGVEEDIAEERLSFWISRSGHTPTSHDAVDVERGLVELRKLGIEQQLWEASRREIDAQESTEFDT